MADDLLGQQRYARHPRWRASGSAMGDDPEEDTSPCVVERHDDRWLWTDADGTLRAVGDAVRVLVATQGGLTREPTPHGFLGNAGVALVRRLEPFTDGWLASLVVAESQESVHAGRPAVDHLLRAGGSTLTLGVDTETGIFTYLQAEELVIRVDLLTVGEAAIHPAFHLLDHVPDVDLSRREPLDPALEPVARTVRTSSGFQVEVVDQEPETVEFHFVLVDGTGHVVGQVRRRRAVWAQSPALFAGSQARAHGEYDVHVDTSFGDPPSASLILRNLLEAVPDE